MGRKSVVKLINNNISRNKNFRGNISVTQRKNKISISCWKWEFELTNWLLRVGVTEKPRNCQPWRSLWDVTCVSMLFIVMSCVWSNCIHSNIASKIWERRFSRLKLIENSNEVIQCNMFKTRKNMFWKRKFKMKLCSRF